MRDHLRLLRGLREDQGHVLRIHLRRLGVHRAVAAVVPEARDRLLEAEPAGSRFRAFLHQLWILLSMTFYM